MIPLTMRTGFSSHWLPKASLEVLHRGQEAVKLLLPKLLLCITLSVTLHPIWLGSEDKIPLAACAVLIASRNRWKHNEWQQNGWKFLPNASDCIICVKIWGNVFAVLRIASDERTPLARCTVFVIDIYREMKDTDWEQFNQISSCADRCIILATLKDI